MEKNLSTAPAMLYFAFFADKDELYDKKVLDAVSFSANNLNFEILGILSNSKTAKVYTLGPVPTYKFQRKSVFVFEITFHLNTFCFRLLMLK
jgi:hypothetical protein